MIPEADARYLIIGSEPAESISTHRPVGRIAALQSVLLAEPQAGSVTRFPPPLTERSPFGTISAILPPRPRIEPRNRSGHRKQRHRLPAEHEQNEAALCNDSVGFVKVANSARKPTSDVPSAFIRCEDFSRGIDPLPVDAADVLPRHFPLRDASPPATQPVEALPASFGALSLRPGDFP